MGPVARSGKVWPKGEKEPTEWAIELTDAQPNTHGAPGLFGNATNAGLLAARIIGVADTFDAITTNRPYQQAYSLDYAVETIKKLTGSRFDAKIVTAFLRAFEAGEVRPRPSRSDSQVLQARAAASR